MNGPLPEIAGEVEDQVADGIRLGIGPPPDLFLGQPIAAPVEPREVTVPEGADAGIEKKSSGVHEAKPYIVQGLLLSRFHSAIAGTRKTCSAPFLRRSFSISDMSSA